MVSRMRPSKPAILTVFVVLACGFLPPGAVASVDSNPPGSASSADPTGIPETLEVPAPRRVAVRLVDGTRTSGPWLGFDAGAVLAEGERVPWSSMAAADRLRLGRDLIRASGPESAAGWGLLLVALELSESGDMVDRARARMERVAGPEAPAVLEAVRARVETIRAARGNDLASREAVTIRRRRPHLEPRPEGRSAIPAPRPGRLPAEVDSDRGTLRSLVEGEVEGLGLHLVPTTHTIVAGPRSLENAAALGVELDQFIEDCRARLGSPVGRPLPGGGVGLLAVDDLDDARLLAARHRLDWPEDERSLIVPRPEGWIVILAPPDGSCAERWAPLMADGTSADACRRVEIARIAGRIAMLEAGIGRVPGWMIDGFAESAAQGLVPTAPLEPSERPAAVLLLRNGGRPASIFATESGEPGWAADGDAHRLGYLFVTRLLETEASVFPGLVADLAAGATIDEAFRRRTGMTRSAWFADTIDWHRTND